MTFLLLVFTFLAGVTFGALLLALCVAVKEDGEW